MDFVVPASRLWRLRLAHALARDKRRLPLLCIPRPCAFASWAPRPSKCERPPPVSATPPWLYLLDPRGPRTGRAGHVCVCLSGPLQLVPRPYEFTSKTHALRARVARASSVCVCVSRLPPNSCHAPMNLPPKPTHSVRGPRGLLCPLGLVQYILIGLVHFHALHALVQIFSSGTVSQQPAI